MFTLRKRSEDITDIISLTIDSKHKKADRDIKKYIKMVRKRIRQCAKEGKSNFKLFISEGSYEQAEYLSEKLAEYFELEGYKVEVDGRLFDINWDFSQEKEEVQQTNTYNPIDISITQAPEDLLRDIAPAYLAAMHPIPPPAYISTPPFFMNMQYQNQLLETCCQLRRN